MGAGLGAVFYAVINYIHIEWRQRLGWNHAIFWRELKAIQLCNHIMLCNVMLRKE